MEKDGKIVLKKAKSVRKRVLIFRNKKKNMLDVMLMRYLPIPLVILFALIFVGMFSQQKFLHSLLLGAFPLVVFIKIYLKS